MKRILAILVAFLLTTTSFGCVFKLSKDRHTGLTAYKSEDYYRQGEYLFSRGNFVAANENYQKLIDQFPFSPYAEDAELKMALGYFQMDEYPNAIASLTDFERMHPTNQSVPLAAYYIAMSYYKQIGREDQDQTPTENALAQFQVLERRFPESDYAELAHERITVCREVLARNQLFISNYYFKSANFRAAESRLAELLQKYPDTPVAAEALYKLGETLEKEGKKYSAAEAFAAETRHFGDTSFAKQAKGKLKDLKQPVDTEEDPLQVVLAETGYDQLQSDPNPPISSIRHGGMFQMATGPGNSKVLYGPDGLPILDRPDALKYQEKGSSAGAGGPVTLQTIRLASSDPPLSVIFDVSGPVRYEKTLESGPGFSALTIHLDNTTPSAKLDSHLVFEKSIFKDCNVKPEGNGTTIVVNTVPVSHFAIVPLDEPPRLLVTFTPQSQANEAMAGSG